MVSFRRLCPRPRNSAGLNVGDADFRFPTVLVNSMTGIGNHGNFDVFPSCENSLESTLRTTDEAADFSYLSRRWDLFIL